MLGGMLLNVADERPIEFLTDDLASGDSKALLVDGRDFEIARIQSSDHPLFAFAYEKLWEEFGPRHEMELRHVIAQRLRWYPAARIGESWMRYEMILVMMQDE